jgi:type VI secretion system protein ImpL
MKRSHRLWLFSGITLLVFLLIGWLLPALLGLVGSTRWLIRAVIDLLGLIAAITVFVWLRAKYRSMPEEAPREGDEIDITFAAAKNRLSSAQGKGRVGAMPVIVVAGPAGSAKTTIVTRSGLDPELIAGEVYRGDAVVPTQAVNVWFAHGNLVLEAGGRVVGDANRWKRMIRHIQPRRLAAALRRGAQAPRVAVVCFGCDELLKPGASEAVPAAAQKMRARLAEMSQQIGIRLPVYVIFTKADRLPYYEDFVRSLTREETREVVGATLPIQPQVAAGAWAERESRRVADAFAYVFRGLAGRRLDILPRETADEVKAGTYEFPREFRKITDLATQFLVDLCRPSQLGVSPFLRGFYFTGVRAVYVHDVGSEPQVQGAPSSGGAMDATGVFNARMLQQMQQQAQQPQAGSRRVPEWAFLGRVFHDVILKDATARGVTAGGTKVNLLRRALVAGVAAAGIILSIGFVTSFFTNRSLLGGTRDALDTARGLVLAGPLPEIGTLSQLDTLRQYAERLDRYQREGPPARLGWLLYAGNRVQTPVRGVFFRKFDELLWSRSRGGLITHLRNLPAAPTEADQYGRTYDALKAYIVTTQRPDSARRDFLTPTLLGYWRTGLGADSQRVALASAQFDFYADELPWGNPYDVTTDDALIGQTQRFLRGFAGDNALYQVLLTEASDSVPEARWTDPTGMVRNDVAVPGAYTAKGWARAQNTLDDVPLLFDRETWVVGPSAVAPEDRERLARTLRIRYTNDYVSHWLDFMRAGRVASFSNPNDAANKLAALSANQSPMLGMLGLVADNTAVDTVEIGTAFRPVHDFAPPGATAISQPAGTYLTGLTALQSAMGQVASGGPMRDGGIQAAQAAANQMKAEVSGLARTFSTEANPRLVGAALTQFLLQPISSAEVTAGAVPLAEINSGGATFCAPFRPLASKYPFNASATS